MDIFEGFVYNSIRVLRLLKELKQDKIEKNILIGNKDAK
jgi:hypothetical protein